MFSLSFRTQRTLAAAGAALALAGCASTPPSANAPTGAVLQTAATHAYHGRFAVRYDDRLGNPQNVYGNFDWQEHGDDVSLELRSPLGQTLAVVKSTPRAASLELPNRPTQYAPDVGDLMQKTLGFELPLAGLRYWLLPTGAPASPAETGRKKGATGEGRAREVFEKPGLTCRGSCGDRRAGRRCRGGRCGWR